MNHFSSWYSVRFARWCWRLVWHRRMAWALITLVSLTVLYYQWENWRSARELAVEHQRLVARIGTDNPADLARGPVPDAQNYFANRLIQSWAKPVKPGSLAMRYEFPAKEFMPEGLMEGEDLIRHDADMSRLMLERWEKNRAAEGKPIPAGTTPLQSLTSALGDAHGLLPQLFVGLDLPYSRMIPSDRELAEAELSDPSEIQLNQLGTLDFLRNLGLHLRTAARTGETEKTVKVATLMLRISEAMQTRRLVGALVSLANYRVTFDAMQEALACPVWTDATLVALARRVSSADDLKTMERGLEDETLCTERLLIYFRERGGAGISQFFLDTHERPQRLYEWWARIPPRGWLDASNAFWVREMLMMLGSGSEISWLDGDKRSNQMKRDTVTDWTKLRPLIGTALTPNMGNVWSVAAQVLFQRRCTFIACALERHRLRHGAFPQSLAAVKTELSAFNVNDLARPGQPMSYRLEPTGYLLWSAGNDAKDHGGDADHDLIWRMKHESLSQP